MLRRLRERAREALASACQVVLSSVGPADIQAEAVACEAVGLALYVLVPRTSDLLFNLETNTSVVATADAWQMRGEARLLAPGERPGLLEIVRRPEAEWCEVAEIRPSRLQLRPLPGQAQGETIDII